MALLELAVLDFVGTASVVVLELVGVLVGPVMIDLALVAVAVAVVVEIDSVVVVGFDLIATPG